MSFRTQLKLLYFGFKQLCIMLWFFGTRLLIKFFTACLWGRYYLIRIAIKFWYHLKCNVIYLIPIIIILIVASPILLSGVIFLYLIKGAKYTDVPYDFLLGTFAIFSTGVWLSIEFNNWQWFSRSGGVVVACTILFNYYNMEARWERAKKTMIEHLDVENWEYKSDLKLIFPNKIFDYNGP